MNKIFLLAVAVISAAAMSFAHPNHSTDPLAIKAAEALQAGHYAEAAELYVRLIEKDDDDPTAYYNAACCFARLDSLDKAFKYLNGAIDHDFTNVQHLKQDPDLVSLYPDPRWPALVERMSAAQYTYLEREGINAELFFMMKEDQAARIGDVESVNWDSAAAKDRERLARVKEIVRDSLLHSSEDYFNAALICQHGSDSTDYLLAGQLASEASRLDTTNGSARWLTAAATDRLLHSIGKPQIFGTQFVKDSMGYWTLEPMDTTIITDEDRARFHVPSLSEARTRAEQMNKESKE